MVWNVQVTNNQSWKLLSEIVSSWDLGNSKAKGCFVWYCCYISASLPHVIGGSGGSESISNRNRSLSLSPCLISKLRWVSVSGGERGGDALYSKSIFPVPVTVLTAAVFQLDCPLCGRPSLLNHFPSLVPSFWPLKKGSSARIYADNTWLLFELFPWNKFPGMRRLGSSGEKRLYECC